MYFVQAASIVSVARCPSTGSSSLTSFSTVTLRLIQWYGFAGFTSMMVSWGCARIHPVFFRCSAKFKSTLSDECPNQTGVRFVRPSPPCTARIAVTGSSSSCW